MYKMQQRKHAKPRQEEVTIINLVGDLRENIEVLLCNINCTCGMDQHLRNILGIYCQKITKLRSQRDYYKSLYEQTQLKPKSWTFQAHETCSQASTNQIDERHKCESNIFELLQKEFMPVSVKLNKCQNDRSSISYLLQQSANPEDSLLISESSTNRNNNDHDHQQRKQNLQVLGRSFQRFLQEKAQQNQTKLKIKEDSISLSSKKQRQSSNFLKPSNRMF